MRVVHDAAIAHEGYRLDVTRTGGVAIACSSPAGEFYARQTLEQVRVGSNYTCVAVSDAPAYTWRGMHFDDCRHFFGKDVLKKTLCLMARYKMNVLHWHLTDDQGWRIAVPGYPELLRFSARRPESPKHGAKMRRGSDGETVMDMDGAEYGPYFYTEADLREIVAFAAERHIRVVPEIELPGHVFAALAAYPELACRPECQGRRAPRCVWGVEKDVLCVGNDKAVKFMEDVLDYVCRVFPSDVVHIGGDECPMDRWKDCPKCRQRIKHENLVDVRGLQQWITRHFVEFLAARGKRALGWDECLAGDGVPKSVIGMCWRIGRQGAEHDWLSSGDLAARGHDVVMTPHNYCYLDYSQQLKEDPFQYMPGCKLSLAKCHSLNPCEGVQPQHRKHVLGGQGNNWSEFTWNQYDLEWKMWPRGCALAEVFWCGDRRPGYADFVQRMKVQRAWLVRNQVNCAPIE